MSSLRRFLAGLACLALSFSAVALSPGARTDNFRLLDHQGRSHELHYFADAKAVVLMVHGNGCPVVRQAWPALREVRDRFGKDGVEFLLLNANLQDDQAAIAAEAAEFGIDLPILRDETQLVAESLGVVRTAEVFVIDPRTWTLRYRGPIDDRLAYGAQKNSATRHYLAEALEAVAAGKPVAESRIEPVGCLVNLPERDRKADHAKISYSERIAPVLMTRCVQCHRPGGVGPWAMTRYEQVRGFAPMIREVIRTQRMPPWHADPHVGTFQGDRSLTPDEARDLIHWIEAGAPRGSGPDPLVQVTPVTSEWAMGEPDLVVELPPFDVPATGVVEYQYPSVANPLGRDVWVRGMEVLPGDKSVVHHVLTGIEDSQAGNGPFIEQLAAFGGYSPGRNTTPFPDGSGVLLRAGARLLFQTHYTPNGKAVRETTRVGYYFHPSPPEHRLRLQFMMSRSWTIPPNAAEFTESIEHRFDKPVLLYSVMPHAHLRGKAAKFRALYPDGKEELLLSVPRYDFNWQTVYHFETPKRLPAGTRIAFDMTWDNSARNPANPDPTRPVGWGDQTWEEMNAGWIRYRDVNDR